MPNKTDLIPGANIENKILLIRGQKVMLDSDLAALYGVTTFNLNKAVKRNLDRFPDDFMFQLDQQEVANLIFQNGISKAAHGGRRYRPYVFTEQGVAMLSSVLRSPRAVKVNIAIMRVFVRLRSLLTGHAELAKKLSELEHHIQHHDQQIQSIFQAIRKLMMPPPEPPRKQIGFQVKD
jgi:hypothetical protein